MSDSRKKYEENLEVNKINTKEWEKLSETNIDMQNINTFSSTSVGGEDFIFNKTNDNLLDEYAKHVNKIEKQKNNSKKDELVEAARNKDMLGNQVGVKYSNNKAPVSSMFKQFNLALEAIALRSKEGHEGKYKNVDQDWMNFKRVPNAIEQYTNGTGRHLMYLGDDEDNLGHEIATAWNALARLQLILEQIKQKND